MKENYIVINGNRIELAEDQIAKIKESFGVSPKTLGDIREGEICKIGSLEFIVLEHTGDGTAVVLKDLWKTDKFDEGKNDYRVSSIREDLNVNFYNELVGIVGKENIVPHSVDLTADDGRVEYESCVDDISLLTAADYRRYVYLLDEHRPGDWWWLATAYSTEANGYTSTVRVVGRVGTLGFSGCDGRGGVRPFCILKSNIFVSE